jgi:hypothetical protein
VFSFMDFKFFLKFYIESMVNGIIYGIVKASVIIGRTQTNLHIS